MHGNVDLLKSAYAAFSAGDLDKATENWADDIIWHAGSVGPIAGDYKGKDEVMGFFATLMQETGGTFKLSVTHVLADDHYAMALLNASAERNGRRFDQPVTHCFRMVDGKVAEFWSFASDAKQVMDVWA